jgi:GDP-4-dehydro-6-deoxy-D-mannose reductase
VVRPFNHIGPRQRTGFVTADFASQVARIEAGLQPPVMQVGNLDVARDFGDVRDFVQAYYLAVTKGEPGQVYNIGAERAYSIREILEQLLAMAKVPIEVQMNPTRRRGSEIPSVVSDCRKFRERTGWQATIPMEQTLRDILDDWRKRVREETATKK